MDLNHPLSNIYQIHRTPFFRRLHRNNADQFEKLKKAYETVRSFDEKPIQLQVKKVRLEKLEKHIKDSLSTPIQGHKSPPKVSQSEIRANELAKARQLGIEYSRNNSNSTSCRSDPKRVQTRQDDSLKERYQRRLDYGNKKSEINKSKILRSQDTYTHNSLNSSYVLSSFRKASLSATKKQTQMNKDKIRKLLMHCLSEDKPDPYVVSSLEEIVLTKNESYWDLMDAIKKQQENLKRYGKFTKKLSTLAISNAEQSVTFDKNIEIFDSKTNVKNGRSEVFIRTFRYSDDNEYLPPPTESLLRIPIEFTEDEDVDNDLKASNSIKHLHLTSCKLPLNTRDLIPSGLKRIDLSQKFGEIVRKTVRKESAIMLANLEKAMKH